MKKMLVVGLVAGGLCCAILASVSDAKPICPRGKMAVYDQIEQTWTCVDGVEKVKHGVKKIKPQKVNPR